VKIGLLLVIGLPHHGEGTRLDLLRRHIIPDHPCPRHDHPTPYSLPLFLVLFLFSVSLLLFPSCHLPFWDSIIHRVSFFFQRLCFLSNLKTWFACCYRAQCGRRLVCALLRRCSCVCACEHWTPRSTKTKGFFRLLFACFLSSHATDEGKPPHPSPPSHPTTLCFALRT
jgi:hypothetical protein